jgi:multiple sugar transport system substrate-binding protein
LIAEFETFYPIKVELIEVAGREVLTKALSMFAAGEKLDVTQCGPGNPEIPGLVRAGVLEPLDDFPGASDRKSTFLPVVQGGHIYQGKFWAVPEEAMYILYNYNAKMWKEVQQNLGIKALPTTYEELVDICIKVKDAGISEYPMLWPAGIGEQHGIHQFYNLVSTYGNGAVFDNSGNPRFEKGDPAREALEWWVDSFQKTKISDPVSLEQRYAPHTKMFGAGEHLFSQSYSSTYSAIGFQQDHNISDDIGMMKMPGAGPGRAIGWAQSWGIAASSKNKEAAWTVLLALCGNDPEMGWKSKTLYCTEMGYATTDAPVLKNDQVLSFWNNWMGEDNTKVYVEANASAISVFDVAQAITEDWYLEWNMKMQPIYHEALAGRISVEEASKRIVELVDQLK